MARAAAAGTSKSQFFPFAHLDGCVRFKPLFFFIFILPLFFFLLRSRRQLPPYFSGVGAVNDVAEFFGFTPLGERRFLGRHVFFTPVVDQPFDVT